MNFLIRKQVNSLSPEDNTLKIKWNNTVIIIIVTILCHEHKVSDISHVLRLYYFHYIYEFSGIRNRLCKTINYSKRECTHECQILNRWKTIYKNVFTVTFFYLYLFVLLFFLFFDKEGHRQIISAAAVGISFFFLENYNYNEN